MVLIRKAPKIIQNRLLMSHSSWTKASNSAWNWSQCEELQSLSWDQGTIKGSQCLNARSFIESQWSLITKEMEMFYFLFLPFCPLTYHPSTHTHIHTRPHTLDLICTDKMDNYFVIFWFMDVFEVETGFNGKKRLIIKPEVIKNLLFLLQQVKLLLLMNNMRKKQLIWCCQCDFCLKVTE